jgi:hypothetical protein
MSDDNITITASPYIWSDDTNMGTGVIAEEITSIDLSAAMSASTITISGLNGTSASSIGVMSGAVTGPLMGGSIGSGITLVDPIEVLEERLAKLEKIIAEEEEVRKRCEAVNNAYNEYRLLLVLAKKNKGDLLTEE